MIYKSSLFFIVLFSFIFNLAFSQNGSDTVLFINGTSLITTVTDTTNNLISYTKAKKPKKIKTVDADRVFSITNSKGESVVYVYDTLTGNELTVQEMRYYILGQQDARKAIKGNGGIIINFIVSAGAGATGSFLTPLVPFAVAGLLGLPHIKVKEGSNTNPEYLKQDAYLMGYEHEGRRKRKVKSLIGGTIGLVMGLGTAVILKESGNEILK